MMLLKSRQGKLLLFQATEFYTSIMKSAEAVFLSLRKSMILKKLRGQFELLVLYSYISVQTFVRQRKEKELFM